MTGETMVNSVIKRPSRSRADMIATGFIHATRQGCSLATAVVAAGIHGDSVNHTGSLGMVERDRASIERGVKRSTQAGNHRHAFALHRGMMRERLRAEWLRPLSESLGIPDAPWYVVADKLTEQGRDDEGEFVRYLFDPYSPMPDGSKQPNVRAYKPVELRRYNSTDQTGRYVVVATFDATHELNAPYDEANLIASSCDEVTVFVVVNNNTKGNDHVRFYQSKGYNQVKRELVINRLTELGFTETTNGVHHGGVEPIPYVMFIRDDMVSDRPNDGPQYYNRPHIVVCPDGGCYASSGARRYDEPPHAQAQLIRDIADEVNALQPTFTPLPTSPNS